MPDGDAPRLPFFSLSRFVHREIIVLLILCAAALAGFLVTKASAAAAHQLRVSDASIWHARGRAHLEAGRIDEALDALGRARALDREQEAYHLSFGAALSRAGQHAAARQVLLALREAHPENPDVNLGLAEMEAARGAREDAIRFYERALYGDWSPDRLGERERVRVGMIEYLLVEGQRRRASAQLMVLAADLPEEAPRLMEAARLFLAAGEPERALGLYSRVLEMDPAHGAALGGAGDAAFALGDYATALGYFARAPGGTAGRRAIAERVVASDPLSTALDAGERRRRLAAGHALAARLIGGCAAHTDGGESEQLSALADETGALGVRVRGPLADGAVADGVALVAAVVTFASDHCGPLDAESRAWLLIARRHHEAAR